MLTSIRSATANIRSATANARYTAYFATGSLDYTVTGDLACCRLGYLLVLSCAFRLIFPCGLSGHFRTFVDHFDPELGEGALVKRETFD
uniref:Uncharacterized protein n=1 Tax=Picea glauca TaxID=3330 RepID=A0A101M366_PICGL|nr:hypothetical protein ABT39_MTgene44 [Picea glauca]QHR86189.1 hypothetical protein Q903MT_gene188 [Picea sitchensis]